MVKGWPSGRRRPAQLGGGRARRRAIGGDGLDEQPVPARPDQREAIVAGGEIVARAAAVGDAPAGDHGRRIARNAVVAEDQGRLAGGGVDEGDPDVRHRRAVRLSKAMPNGSARMSTAPRTKGVPSRMSLSMRLSASSGCVGEAAVAGCPARWSWSA